MNTTGFVRGLMAKNVDEETFLTHVLSSIEKQLKEWNEDYKLRLIKLANYEVVVQRGKIFVNVTITKEQLEFLQSRSPFALDHYIWSELKRKGVEIERWTGNYLTYIFG